MAIDKEHQSKKNKKRSKKIVFDDEVITKDSATKLINELGSTSKPVGFKREDKKLTKNVKDEIKIKDIDNASKPNKKSKTRRKLSINSNGTNHKKLDSNLKKELEGETNEEGSDTSEFEKEIESVIFKADNQTAQKEESIRARKRRRHMELIQTKKIRSELNLQEKCLNYLSLWKHSRTQWKFEKLKQIWLQQNMFDDVKIPDEFWDTLVEYFNSAKGQAKSNILSEATKIVDGVSDVDKEGAEKTNAKYIRARNVVQILQE